MHGGPFQPGGETCAAPATQAGFFDFVNDVSRGHLLQGFVQRLIRAVLQSHVNLVRILDAPLLAGERGLKLGAFVQRSGDDALRLRFLALVEILDDAIEL